MEDDVSRRDVLKHSSALTAVGVTGFAGCVGDGEAGGNQEDGGDGQDGGDDMAQFEDETIRVGILQPVSGDLQYYGEISLMGFFSGLAYKHDADPIEELTSGTYELDTGEGLTYELHVEDTELVPDTAQSVAEDLVIDAEIDVLFGTSSSDSARQVINTVVDQANVPFLVGPAADSDITESAEYCHELAFRASEHTAMDARAGGRYVAQEGTISTVAIFAADYSFGQSVARNYQQVLEAEGIEVLEPRFVEQGYSEFEGLFDEAVDAGADGVVGGFTAQTLPQFLSTAVDYDVQVFGGFADLLTNSLIGDTIEAELGSDFTAEDVQEAGLGPFTTRYHWNQYDNEINDEFIDIHVDAYGIVPDLFSSGTFTAASALSQAIGQSGSTDGQDVADALRGMTVQDTPKGADAYTFQEHNNQAASAMTVAWPVPTSEEFADTWDAVIMPGEPLETLPADEVMVPADESDCDLA